MNALIRDCNLLMLELNMAMVGPDLQSLASILIKVWREVTFPIYYRKVFQQECHCGLGFRECSFIYVIQDSIQIKHRLSTC